MSSKYTNRCLGLMAWWILLTHTVHTHTHTHIDTHTYVHNSNSLSHSVQYPSQCGVPGHPSRCHQQKQCEMLTGNRHSYIHHLLISSCLIFANFNPITCQGITSLAGCIRTVRACVCRLSHVHCVCTIERTLDFEPSTLCSEWPTSSER